MNIKYITNFLATIVGTQVDLFRNFFWELFYDLLWRNYYYLKALRTYQFLIIICVYLEMFIINFSFA